MSVESIYITAFLIGLLGGNHCVGMCGGIVTALTIGLSNQKRNDGRKFFTYQLSYNTGRILTYTLTGALAASIGAVSEHYGFGMQVRKILTLTAASVMIFLGLYLTGRWKTAIIKIENIGSVLWRRIEPLAKNFIPIRSISHALIAGILWEWLPCGLVYSALFLAMSANSISQGALIMWSFGIGTLPVLLGLGYVSTNFIAHLQKQWVRTTAGTIIICFGIFQFKILFFS